jgi:RsbT co-antagonist protein rsbRD N-terminal domain
MATPLTVPTAQPALRSHEKSQSAGKESVAATLSRCKAPLIHNWLARVKKTPQLSHLHLRDDERTGHLPRLVDDLVTRLGKPKSPHKDSDAIASPAATEHGRLRRTQGYSSSMLIHESRILQVTIFETLHENLGILDFNLLLPDVMIIADEVDSQLTQTMESFTTGAPKSAKTQLVKPKA